MTIFYNEICKCNCHYYLYILYLVRFSLLKSNETKLLNLLRRALTCTSPLVITALEHLGYRTQVYHKKNLTVGKRSRTSEGMMVRPVPGGNETNLGFNENNNKNLHWTLCWYIKNGGRYVVCIRCWLQLFLWTKFKVYWFSVVYNFSLKK